MASRLVTPAVESMPRTPIRGRSPGVGEYRSAGAYPQPTTNNISGLILDSPQRRSRPYSHRRAPVPPSNSSFSRRRESTHYLPAYERKSRYLQPRPRGNAAGRPPGSALLPRATPIRSRYSMDLEVAPMTLELFHQPATNHHPHTLVCRRQPESAIAKSIRPPSWIGDG